ncbi:MAG: nuclear transport factor 2 family protein [Chloroflexi bacterium]|nr:nuclear transport factor 2 family protein [Chloroflexota bacterium]
MKSIDVAQQYFNAWNAHDPSAVIATFAPGGTYSDPTVEGLTGEAIGHMVQRLINSFHDLFFDIVSIGAVGPDLVAAEWLMQGTHQEMGGRVALPGSDFIRVESGKIRSVQGYYDNGTILKQLGLELMTYPAQPQGPISFGSATRAQTDKRVRPGAISLTWIESHSDADGQYVSEYTQKIVEETTQMPGFLGIMLSSIDNRGYTLTAWEDVEQPRRLLREGQHKESMKWFFSEESGAFAMASVWELHHMRMMVRCSTCHKVVDVEANRTTCSCGEPLPDPPPYF